MNKQVRFGRQCLLIRYMISIKSRSCLGRGRQEEEGGGEEEEGAE